MILQRIFHFKLSYIPLTGFFSKTVSLENDLKKYNSEISFSNLNKNKDFYQKYYGGIEGIKSYFEQRE